MAERRDARAKVLQALAKTEHARWDPTPYKEFIDAGHELYAAALIAQVPRRVVVAYVTMALAAHRASTDDPAKLDSEGNAVFGGLSSELSDVVQVAAAVLATNVWHPWRTKLTRRGRLRQLDTNARALKPEAGRGANPVALIDGFNPWVNRWWV